MDFKKWLKEEKGGGGIGVFLILVIIAAAVYAIEFSKPKSGSTDVNATETTYTEDDLVSSEEGYMAANPAASENFNTAHQPIYRAPENSQPQPLSADSLVEERNTAVPPTDKPASTPEAEKKSGVTAASSSKAKPKATPKRKRSSREEIVKRKLKQGKTVRQIAEETGLDKKYIRDVKRRTQQVIW